MVDPWEASAVLEFLDQRGLRCTKILNTHEHFDHVRGNEELVKSTCAEVYCHHNALGKIPCASRGLKARDELSADEDKLTVLDTPGHTMAHICLLWHKKGRPFGLISGDTLFNAGVGNCHNGGDPETLYETVRDFIDPLPDDVVLYPGHDYLANNLRFSLACEPANREAQKLLAEWGEKHESADEFLPSTMGQEREVNAFFRLDSESIRRELELSESCTNKEVFLALRSKRNKW